MSSIMKGIVDEGEEVVVIYIDGKPSTKYAKKHEAEMDAARMREKFPNKKIEIKQEVRETEAIKGADGKRCWKGKRYAGTENGKDKCIPVKEESDDQEKLEIGKRVWLKNQTHANSPIHGKLHSLNDTHAILNTGGRYYRAKRDNVTHDRDQSFLNAYKNDDKINEEKGPSIIKGHTYRKNKRVNSYIGIRADGWFKMFTNPRAAKEFAHSTYEINPYKIIDPKTQGGTVNEFTDTDNKFNRGGGGNEPIPVYHSKKPNLVIGYVYKDEYGWNSEEANSELGHGHIDSKLEAIQDVHEMYNEWLHQKKYSKLINGKWTTIPAPDNAYSDPPENESANPAQQAAIAIAKKKKAKTNEGVIVGHDAKDPEVAILGGAGTMSLSRLRDKAIAEARQLARDLAQTANFKAAAHNIKQLANTLNTIVAAENEMEKSYFGEDYTGEFAAEVTPATNPYDGLKDRQHRGAISEDRGTQEVGYQLQDLAHEIKELADNAMRLVRGTPEEGRARSYWYPHIVMAVSEDHGYMGRNMFTMIDSAESLINGEEDDEYIDEMPDTSGPVGTQPGGWRTYSPKQAGQVDESRMHQYDINDAIKKLEAYRKSENYSSKVSSTRLENVLRNWQNQTDNGIVTRAQLLRTPNMGKQAMALLDTLMGNTSNDTDPMIQNKKQSLAIVDSLKQAIASDDMQSILDLLRELKNSIGAMDRLSYKKVKEDTAYATGMGQGGAAGQSYRKFKPKSAGTFKEEQLDEKCWDTHKQVGMKKKGDKMVPNCVPKESAIMKGLKR